MLRQLPAAVVATALVIFVSCSDSRSVANDAESARTVAATSAPDSSPLIATTDPSVLAMVGDVAVQKGGFGSAIALVPGRSRDLYMLTDRGPNYDGPSADGSPKRFPDPRYAPRIYRASISGTTLRIEGETILKSTAGVPITGLPLPNSACGSTHEIAQTVTGEGPLSDMNGLDPEGIVALDDGTFWVSDEYGPFLVHFDADGREVARFSPCNNGGMPEVYKLRRKNRGMEGLTITPDKKWLVGAMQAPLENPTSSGVRDISRATRILFKHLENGSTKEYLYLLDDPAIEGISEIMALSDTRFLVLERDAHFLFGTPAAALKRIYEIDISDATEISSMGAMGAKPVNGKTIERATVEEIRASGIRPVTKTQRVELTRLGFAADKAEGMALAPDGWLFVSTDDDFGIRAANGEIVQKLVPPTNKVDKPSVWQIRFP
jgi:hypothetical protein